MALFICSRWSSNLQKINTAKGFTTMSYRKYRESEVCHLLFGFIENWSKILKWRDRNFYSRFRTLKIYCINQPRTDLLDFSFSNYCHLGGRTCDYDALESSSKGFRSPKAFSDWIFLHTHEFSCTRFPGVACT